MRDRNYRAPLGGSDKLMLGVAGAAAVGGGALLALHSKGAAGGDAAPPTNVKVSNVTTTGATVTWSLPTGATSASVLVDNAVVQSDIAGGTATLTGLNPATAYRVSVIAHYTYGDSVATKPVGFTTLAVAGAPLPPSGVQATAITSNSAVIDWTPDTYSHTVELLKVGRYAVPAGTSSLTLSGLIANTQYKAYVRSQNAAGLSAAVGVTFTTTA